MTWKFSIYQNQQKFASSLLIYILSIYELSYLSIYLTGAFTTSSSLFLEILLDKLRRTEVVGFKGGGGFLNTDSDIKVLNLN
jgi:hypothetical protein